MISGASYNVFNGEEHLLPSLRAMRNNVDYINIVAQKVSNAGNSASNRLDETIERARSGNLFDEIVWYSPDLTAPPVINELNKRNIGLESAKRAGMTHFMTMDCDEYYLESEFKFAKEKIEALKLKSTSVQTYLHIKRPIWRSRLPDDTCCAFLSAIEKSTKIELNSYYPTLTDGTRRINGGAAKFHFFPARDIAMRHMNLVRLGGLNSKLENSSNHGATGFMKKVKHCYDHWHFGINLSLPNKPEFQIIEVDDVFNIDSLFKYQNNQINNGKE
jgi:hypothetical protein